MRLVFAALILLHGLIHLLGFVGELSLAKLEGITPSALPAPWKQLLGVSWLLVTLLFLGTFAAFLLRWPAWWMLGLPAVLLSQLLILVYWSNAKFGTIANLIMVLPVVLAFGASRFDARVDSEIERLFERAGGSATTVDAAMLEGLPAPVQRWLTRSGVVGRELVRVTRLKQVGLLRTAPEASWMPAVAHQYFSFEPPGFVWRTRVSMMKVLPVEGRDLYADGHGQMLITLGGLVPFVDGRGEKIDQGTLLRFLGELVWTPSAALGAYISWATMDDTHARATMTFGGVSASAEFEFDAEGRQLSMAARRYMGAGEDAVLSDWFVRSTEWRRFDGIEVPSKGEVLWKLPDGEFSYYQWEITEVGFNPAGRYDAWRRE